MLVAAIRPLRRLVVPPTTRAVVTIWDAFRSPWQMALLVGGNAVATLLSTWCLMACLAAFGGGASFWSLLAANIGVVTIASLVPIPGGGTAVGTVGLSAVLVSFGVTRDVAVAAALANQLVYYYLPSSTRLVRDAGPHPARLPLTRHHRRPRRRPVRRP